MWYVIQTLGGREEKTASMVKKSISASYINECFVPKRERIKKFHGCWNKTEEILFQGYVFVNSNKPERLYGELKKLPKLTKIIGREENYFIPLSKEEENLIRGLGNKEHKTLLSRVELQDGKKIRVIQGPLKNYIENVVKVNMHKREAVVKVKFMGKEMDLYMGIEMEK